MNEEIRLMRGQVVIREHLRAGYERFPSIVIPDVSTKDDRDAIARNRTWHRGEVLAIGAPAQTTRGVEVPHGFGVGDVVLFHWKNNERAFTRPWTDGELACWIPQNAVDAVLEMTVDA